MNIGLFIGNYYNPSEDSNIPNDFELFDELKISDYTSTYNGTGKEMNIALHQSYLNNSFDIALNLSNSNNNTILIPCPTDTNFNSSYTRISTEDIYAPNKTLIVEDDSLGLGFENFIITNYYASFTPKGVGYIENISLLVKLIDIGDHSNLTIRLYNSENDGGNIRPLTNLGTIVSVSNVTSDSYYWHKITNIHAFFNCTETYSDTFFFRVGTIGGSVYWDWSNDVGSDGIDEMIALNAVESPLQFSGNTIDLPLKIDFTPLNNTPKPSEIGLKINNTEVSNDIGNSGYWLKENQEYGDIDGNLDFELSADWWDVTCKVSQVLINYTKTDLKASSEFSVAGSHQVIEWNVSKGGLYDFGSEFNNYQINFTIPDTWDKDSIRVYNSTNDRTSDCTNRSIGNWNREVNVKDAHNDFIWYLTANSTNYLSSITSYIDSGTPNKFNFTNFVHFNATFTTYIDNGDINLSVYSPVAINNLLNFSLSNNSFIAGKKIFFGNWDISDNVTQYGVFRIKLGWNNNTDAGFLEDTIEIVADTALKILEPPPDTVFDVNEIFNITISFNDTGQSQYISDADVQYKINNGPYSTINENVQYINNGEYIITFDCNNTQFNYGPNTITVKAGGTYYNNQTETLDLKILGLTDLFNTTSVRQSFNSTETFVVSLFFNDTIKESGISGATRSVFINGTPYTPISNIDNLDGSYDITIDCDANYFDSQDYGYFNLSFSLEKSYHYNKTIWFKINIKGNTSLSTTKFPEPIIGYYNSDEMFNITARYIDVGRGEGIDYGIVSVYVKEVGVPSYDLYSPVIIDPLVGGYYNITVNCSDPIFRPYGKYDIKINITKQNYYTAEDILTEIVIGNTTLTILEPTMPISYVENELFNITIEYKDHTLSTGV
ncbi:MAG: hypothetical protein ACFFDN_46115, partial [Candidatus Hodarchaeota archaeon]